MEKNFDDFSVKEAQRLAKTAAGQQLMALFQQQQGAIDPGDPKQLKQALAAFMQDPQAKKLLQQLQEASNERNGR